MDDRIYKKSVKEAKRIMSLIKDISHDTAHAKAVAYYAAKIGKKLNYPDIKFLKLAAWWHDAGRLYQEDHEKLSAQMARDNILSLGASKEEAKEIFDAIKLHKWTMKPETLEGNIIRDADKLDCLSISRWKKSEKSDKKYIKSLTPLLPKLKSIFYFDISKVIYDKKAKLFYAKIKPTE